ncbi:MAG: flagellar basal body-associated FliL family protein [Acidimicrobiales bacterium]
MARKKTREASGDEDGALATKGRSKLVPAVVVALLLAGGGYYMTSGGGGDATAVAGEAIEEPAPVRGEVVPLEPVTLNLADGRFLKVGLALQLVEGAAAVDAAGIAGFAAPALDEAISVLGARSYAELVAPGGRDAVKQALSERVAARYEGEVLGVYFTEFVMQ